MKKLVLTWVLVVSLAGAAWTAPRKPAPAPVTLEEARRSAEMLDDAYRITLLTIHETYPIRTGQPIVAASVVRRVQEKLNARGGVQTRFLAVNALVMNPDHRARDAFEKDAVTALRSGKERFEAIVNNRLRVATSLSLTGSCFSCHWSDSKVGSRAAISYSIPIKPSPAVLSGSR